MHAALTPPPAWERFYFPDPQTQDPDWLLTYDDGTEEYLAASDLKHAIALMPTASFTLSLCL